MNPRLRRAFLLWLLLCPLLPGGTVQVRDFRGKALSLPRPARRIVCLMESALSGLYMLGAQDQVVGVPAQVYRPPVQAWYTALDDRLRQRRLPAPGNWDFVSLEGVIALRPDLVILWSSQGEVIAALESRGIPVYGIFLKSREDLYREIRDLGTLTGHSPRAEELVAYTRAEVERFAQRTRRIPMHQRPGVYFMWAQGKLETSGGGSTVDDLLTLAGGRNVAGDIPREHVTVGLERLLGWNPDLIVMWNNERLTPAQVMGDPQWRSVQAIQKGRIHMLSEVFLCDLWTLKYPFAIKQVAQWCHPGLFRDLNLAQEEQAMLKHLYGRELKR